MALVFWGAFAFIVYVYAGYPALVWVCARFRRPQQLPPAPDQWPGVSVIVPFCNEPERVASKLETLRQQSYSGPLQIIFVADGAGDATAETVVGLQSKDVTTVVLPQRSGKPSALNAGVEQAQHPLIFFTDARQQLEPDVIEVLVRRCADQDVAAVSGELVLLGSDNQARIGLYWRYEKFIRKAESRLSSVPGVTGAVYMIKRQHVRPLPVDTLLDDFDMPLAGLRQGKRIMFESGAVAYDMVAQDVQREKIRKVRTLTGNFQSFFRHPWLFSPFSNPIWWQFMSHKVARLLVPYALLMVLVLPMFIGGAWMFGFVSLQLAFYFLALGKHQNWYGCRGSIAAFSLLFTELNVAAVLAAWSYFRAPLDARWERTA